MTLTLLLADHRKENTMTTIGSQDGIKAFHNAQRDLMPDKTLLKKTGGKWPDISTLANTPLDQWKAIDKHQRTEQILKDDHDANQEQPYPRPPTTDLQTVQARIFLAGTPLDALQAPAWMVPVITADQGYRHEYAGDTIDQLRRRFGLVEVWCDCRNPTAYTEALAMSQQYGLAGCWGQCENEVEFDNAYADGARRMIGQLSGLRPDQTSRVANAEVLITFELYRNVMPWQTPDYGSAGRGVGGNTIACYASSTEGATYYPVSRYKADGYYVPKRDGVYGVGLLAEDWANLA